MVGTRSSRRRNGNSNRRDVNVSTSASSLCDTRNSNSREGESSIASCAVSIPKQKESQESKNEEPPLEDDAECIKERAVQLTMSTSDTTFAPQQSNSPISEGVADESDAREVESLSRRFQATMIESYDQDFTASSIDGNLESDLEKSAAGQYDGVRSRDRFSWLIGTGRMISIDPLDTIPLTCIREVSESGVSKLEYAFMRSQQGPGMSMGLSSAAPQPIVVRIPEDRLHLVVEYFVRKKRLSEDNAHAISTSKIWYGIIEGAHRRKALINLSEKHPDQFKGYSWIVLCVEWQPMEIMRAFARDRNELLRGEHLVAFTVYDVLKNLKMCADEVATREGLVQGRVSNRGYRKRVADHYCGGKDSANNMTLQLTGIAIVLSWNVIEEMGRILNSEEPLLAKSMNSATSEGDCDLMDARVCKKLLTKSTFRGATTFKSVACEEDQINALRRLHFLAPQSNYKSVTKIELELQTKKAIAAREEVEKMASKIQGHSWPADMVAVKHALLTKTVLDEEIEKNAKSNDLLPVFQSLWERFFPLAVELESSIMNPNCSHDTETAIENICSTPFKNAEPDPSAPYEHDNGQNTSEELHERNNSGTSDIPARCDVSDEIDDTYMTVDKSSGDASCESASHEAEDEDEDEMCLLKQFKVRAENKSWWDFHLSLSSEDLFDFVYADPQQSLSASELKQNIWTEFQDHKKMREFANFCRIALRPGCYCFVFVLAAEFDAWCSAFLMEGMKVMKAPFLVIPEPNSARVTRLKELPQSCGDLAIVARTPGRNRGFNVNFSGSYSKIECRFSRRLGVISDVPKCHNPLRGTNSRAEVRPRERHPDLVSEILETFCPPTGTVLDSFGGAMTSVMSCISSGRPCVALEKDPYCFDLAIRRIEKLCRDLLLSPDDSMRDTSGSAVHEISQTQEEEDFKGA